MSIQEFRSQSVLQLNEQLAGLKKEQFGLRFQAAAGELNNPARIRQVRREIAKIHTVLSEQKKKVKG